MVSAIAHNPEFIRIRIVIFVPRVNLFGVETVLLAFWQSLGVRGKPEAGENGGAGFS